MAFRHHLQRYAVLLHRSDQPNALFYLAIIQHEARGRDLHGRPVGTLIDQQDGTMIGKTADNIIHGHTMITSAFGDREKPGLGAGGWVNVDGPTVGHDKTLGAERLQS